ncbi:MAG: ATP-binding protein [Acidobacteriota bacterium]
MLNSLPRRLGTILIAVLFVAVSGVATLAAEQRLDRGWRLAVGDDRGWAEPDFDDRAWRSVELPATWEELEVVDHGEVVWLRRTVALDLLVGGSMSAVAIGEGRFGGYTLYVDGEAVGGHGDGISLPTPRPRVFSLPRRTWVADQRVVLALRFEQAKWPVTGGGAAGAGPVGEAGVTLGARQALEDRTALHVAQARIDQLVAIALPGILAVLGLIQVQLYTRRQRQRGHLWLGLMCFVSAAVAFISSAWVFAFTDSFGAVLRWRGILAHLSTAVFVQFLWPFLGRSIGRVLRAYQISQVALGVLIGVVPMGWVVLSRPARMLWLMPMIVGALWLLFSEVRGGHRQARVIGIGMALFTVTIITETVAIVAGMQVAPISAGGFLVFVLSLSFSIDDRVDRLHDEIDALRRKVSRRVEMRTAELHATREQLDAEIEARKKASEDRLRLEARVREVQKLDTLRTVSGEIAHDFNNLLMTMQGNALLLREVPSDEDTRRQRLHKIEQSAGRAAELTRQLVSIATDEVTQDLQPIEVAPRIEAMHELLNTVIARRATLHLELVGDAPAVPVDPGQLRQLLINLVTNAADAIGSGGGEIVIATRTVEADRATFETSVVDDNQPPGTYLSLAVRDNGAGMDETTRQRIFDPFFSTKFSGRGLGLAAVLGIVRAYDGGIRVESEVGEGTAIEILLPVIDDPVGDRAVAAIAAWRSKGLVLLVDEEPAVREVTASLLEHHGLTVVAAQGGQDAIDLLRTRQHQVRLIVLDFDLGEIDDQGTLRELTRIAPSTPIIGISAYHEAAVFERVESGRLAGFVAKPFQAHQLIAVARDALER